MDVRKPKRKTPLPLRGGLGATRARVPEGAPVYAGDFIWHLVKTQRYRHPMDDRNAVAERFARGEVVLNDATPLCPDELIAPGTDVFFYRRPAPEERVPFDIEIVYEDTNLLVVNKPPFLASMPRASHITENATVRLRRATGNEELTPAHRLDRMTAGLLLFTKRADLRGAYQQLFAERKVRKLYEAIAAAPTQPISLPVTWRHHIDKEHGRVTATILEDREPNSTTILHRVDPLPSDPSLARYLLEPVTGRTHQLRIHMNAAGVPIKGDPFYPVLKPADEENYEFPMLLTSVRLVFVDPLTGDQRRFTATGPSGLDIPEMG